MTSLFTLAVIAFNRYYLIGHSQSYPRVFSKTNSLVMCGAIWLLANVIMLPTITGWTRNKYNPKTNACSYARDESKAYHYLLLVVAYGIPLVVVVVSYGKLYYIVRSSRQRVVGIQMAVFSKADSANKKGQSQQQGSEKSDVIPVQTANVIASQKPAANVNQREMKLTRMLVVIFLVFLVLISPYALANVLDDHSNMSRTVHTLFAWMMFLNCAVNPLLYAWMNPTFREAYLVLLTARCKGPHMVPGIDLNATAPT